MTPFRNGSRVSRYGSVLGTVGDTVGGKPLQVLECFERTPTG
jgi:hypothetical protein